MQLKNRVALVTGGSSGIGLASALLLAKEGARVGVLDVDEKDTLRTVDRIARGGGEAIPLVADVSSSEQVRLAVEETVERWGRLDILFANAGVNGVWAPLDDLTPEDFDRTIRINLYGTFYSIKHAAPHLKKRGGSVIVTSSVNGTRIFSNTGATAYSCSKAAQVAMAKMLAIELGPHGVRVNVVCPGAIDTNIDENTELRDVEEVRIPVEYPEGRIPLTGDRPGKAADVARLVLFLASDASRHISGTEVWIDGAQSLLQG